MNFTREGFHNIRDYVLYYGSGREHELAGWDMAVLEPAGHDRDDIMKLKQGGTIAIAYLSALEVSPLDPDFAIVKDCLLKNGPEFIKNDIFGTNLTDMGSGKWNEYLIYKASRLCSNEGYDGIFLDTIGNVETGLVPAALRRPQFIHTVNFVKALRERLPDNILIQNNGVEELFMYTSEYIDGCCWEGPGFFERGRDQYNNCILNNLKSMGIEEGVKILLLTQNIRNEEQIGYIQRLSESKNFLYYNAPFGYTSLLKDIQNKK